MQEHVGVGLFVRALRAVALGVGHARAEDDVVALRVAHELQVALVIGRATLRIDIEGDRMEHTDRVEPGAALEAGAGELAHATLHRSEEHTSELQSLMRNSYAVFCLQKKTNTI